jgi:alkanesulfonate monooxygenase SsuD/methylene tetrahydromethanopterin reductase-like flavin-dependent oxidoreductase (luciferase family)
MATSFGFCAPIFAGSGGAHSRTPLVERVDYDELEGTVVAAEKLGYDSVWVADHLILGREGFILEGWTVMAALARVTRTMRLGSIHYANLFRPPAMSAKMAATLDFISGGRLDFFFDPYAGKRADSHAYGLEDDGTAIDRFAEALELIKFMWSEEKPTWRGKYYAIEEAVCLPRPVQTPSIPIWIGTSANGDAERRRRISAIMSRHADWWNITPASVEGMREALGVLRDACASAGRDYKSIRKSFETQILVAESESDLRRWKERIDAANPGYGDWDKLAERFLIGDVKTVTRRMQQYADLGVECFLLWFMDYPARDGLRLFAEKVMPYFR